MHTFVVLRDPLVFALGDIQLVHPIYIIKLIPLFKANRKQGPFAKMI